MNPENNEPRHGAGAGGRHESARGGADVIVPQLIARPVPVQTSGRTEFAARCPQCKSWHRHIGLGEKVAPCGTTYVLEFADKGAA